MKTFYVTNNFLWENKTYMKCSEVIVGDVDDDTDDNHLHRKNPWQEERKTL